MTQPLEHSRIRIDQMDCPSEEALIRNRLRGMESVRELDFNLVQRVLTVRHEAGGLPPILQALTDIGLAGVPEQEGAPRTAPPMTRIPPGLIVAGVAALGAEVAHWLDAPGWLVLVLAIVSIGLCGLSTYRKGWLAIRSLNLNMNALMSIAVTGAVLIGQWPEAAMVMFLFTLAELIEARSLDRARAAIHELVSLAPDEIQLRQADGNWLDVPTAQVPVGSLARARPGERIALDGRVVEGASAVDQSPITGESVPVDKRPGDMLYAGSINTSGMLVFETVSTSQDSTLARVAEAVESAQGSKAPTQRFVDSFARYYTPAVFLVALLVAVVPPLVFGMPWLDALYRALVLLVIACPCALVISTPVTIVSGLATAARQGILIKGGAYLETARMLSWAAFDKTGTITQGRPSQLDMGCFEGATLDPTQAQQLGGSLAAQSDHPVSQAIAAQARQNGLAIDAVEQFAAIAGGGIEGVIGGQRWLLGNARLMRESGIVLDAVLAQIDAAERAGRTVVLLAAGSRVQAWFGVADQIKPSSREALATLHGMGVKTMMLSGDNPHVAAVIAESVGLDDVRAGLLPEDKQAVIRTLQAQGGRVAMVGDGINDAPALAQADVGIAMGALGSDIAIASADVAIMDDDLRKLPQLVALSRRTSRILVQNITLALSIKAVFVALAFAGQATMWMAVFADMGASLLVVFNGLRLLGRRPSASRAAVPAHDHQHDHSHDHAEVQSGHHHDHDHMHDHDDRGHVHSHEHAHDHAPIAAAKTPAAEANGSARH